MKNFNQDRGNRFGGGNDRGHDRRKEFTTMHSATCSNCGKTCEVPFRPTNGKPVYCKECFSEMGGGQSSDRFPRKEFAPRNEGRNDSRSERKPEGNDDVKRQLELVNSKLDKLIAVAENFLKPKPAQIYAPKVMPAAPEVPEAPAPAEKTTLKKLVTKAIGKKSSKNKK